jgi:hypothetical protein
MTQHTIKKCLMHSKYIKSACTIVARADCDKCIGIKKYLRTDKGKSARKRYYLKAKNDLLRNYVANRRLASKKYYQQNRERILKKRIAYRHSIRDKVRAYNKNYYQANKAKILLQRKSREENP